MNLILAFLSGSLLTFVILRAISRRRLRKLIDAAEESPESFGLLALRMQQVDRIIEIFPAAIVRGDSNDNIFSINKKGLEVFGYPRDELHGKPLDLLIPNTIRRDLLKAMRDFQNDSDDRKGTRVEVTLKRKDGSRFPAELALAYVLPGRHSSLPDNVAVFGAVITDLTQSYETQQQLRDLVDEKDLLLIEVHHRVKNNLQVISSLFNLELDSIQNLVAARLLRGSQQRLRSIALLHDLLDLKGGYERVSFRVYSSTLVSGLLDSYGSRGRIHVDIRIPDISLSMNTALPCGLIVTELISNSLKHAFSAEASGNILLALEETEDPGKLRLIVRDDGIGLPPDVDPGNPETLGLNLVRRLAEQLRGELAYKAFAGTEITLVFPKSAHGAE